MTLEEVLQLALDEALIDADEHHELVDELDDLRSLCQVVVGALNRKGPYLLIDNPLGDQPLNERSL